MSKAAQRTSDSLGLTESATGEAIRVNVKELGATVTKNIRPLLCVFWTLAGMIAAGTAAVVKTTLDVQHAITLLEKENAKRENEIKEVVRETQIHNQRIATIEGRLSIK